MLAVKEVSSVFAAKSGPDTGEIGTIRILLWYRTATADAPVSFVA